MNSSPDLHRIEFTPKNKIYLLFLKLINKEKYRFYKEEKKIFELYKKFYNSNEVKTYFNKTNNTDVITFKHSGHTGDVIYSLPVVKSLSEKKKIYFYLNPNAPAYFGRYYKNTHPYGKVQLTLQAINMLIPLIKTQSYIEDCKIYNKEEVTYDLDEFRNLPLMLDRGCIAEWYFHLFGTTYNLSEPWLQVPVNSEYKDSIIIARSFRYRNVFINYRFLNKYKKVFFIGVENEYINMKEQIPSIEWIKVQDFLEMASIISGCRLFIGNQSFPFSLAEALKVPRVLEVYPQAPNVIPIGDNAYSFYFQQEFAFVVEKNMSK